MGQQDDFVFSCPECGTEVVKGASGCSKCGTKLEWDVNEIEADSLTDERGSRYLSNEKRAATTKWALVICAILAGLEIVLIILAALNALNTPSLARWSAQAIVDRAPGLLDVAQLYIVAAIGVTVAFLMWIHRAFSNLEVLGAAPGKYTPKSAVVRFLIPIVNIEQSIGIMSDLWRRSDFQSGILTTSRQGKYVKEVQS